MRILGIETSCDETGLAIYDEHEGLLGHVLHSQANEHAVYGGVVPELASRDHVRRTLPLLNELFASSKTTPDMLDGVAYTRGPGLMGALLVGGAIGRSLAFGWDLPAVGVHHMEGHLLAAMLESEYPELPFLALLVSGGHTLLVQVNEIGTYELLGESVDDAAGEAFDKTAKLLGLGYPGGAALSKLAMNGKPGRYRFPRPMTNCAGLDFSFSGLKTFASNTIAAEADDLQTRADIAYAFVDAVVDTLVIKCRRTIKQTQIKQLVIAGGVSANQQLRQNLGALMEQHQGKIFYPSLEFCTDNGAMIAYAGLLRLKQGDVLDNSFQPKPRWPLTEI